MYRTRVCARADESGGSASEWLLAWINLKLESQEVSVKNFVRDWNDGIALGALVNVLAPGSLLSLTSCMYTCTCTLLFHQPIWEWTVHVACCTDWRRWDPEDGLHNVSNAMAAADQWLEIPQVHSYPEKCVVIH